MPENRIPPPPRRVRGGTGTTPPLRFQGCRLPAVPQLMPAKARGALGWMGVPRPTISRSLGTAQACMVPGRIGLHLSKAGVRQSVLPMV